MAKRRNKRVGSSFDEFLRTERLYEDVTQPQPAWSSARPRESTRPARDRPEGRRRRRQAAHNRPDGCAARGLALIPWCLCMVGATASLMARSTLSGTRLALMLRQYRSRFLDLRRSGLAECAQPVGSSRNTFG